MVEDFYFLPEETAPKPFDVVWCHFPYFEFPDEPGPKARPGLVRSVAKHPETGALAVEVVYGSTKMNKPGFHLYVTQPNDVIEAGLKFPTRFDLSKIKRLHWAAEFFTIDDNGNGPIIGRLSNNSKSQLAYLMSTVKKQRSNKARRVQKKK